MQTSGVPNSDGLRAGDGFTDLTVMYESESGYSVLYRAQKGGKWFALKGIKREVGAQAKYESILRREFDLHKEVTSIYCAECYELITHPDAGLCIVMQYVDGITMTEWLRLKPSKSERKRVLSELLEAMEGLHLQQIIHQDLKPDNILITNNGHHVKLIDFGLSDNDAYISRARGCTNKYAAPELQCGGDVSFASDIWSLGCILNDIYPHKYCYSKHRCHKPNAEKRFKSVNELRKSLKRIDTAKKTLPALLIVALLAIAFTQIIKNGLNKQQEVIVRTVVETVEAKDTLTKEEKSYAKLIEMVHYKYDSCLHICEGKIDSSQYVEFAALYQLDFTKAIDSIRKKYQPSDSIENLNFNNDFLEYQESQLIPLADRQNRHPSYTTLPESEMMKINNLFLKEIEKR